VGGKLVDVAKHYGKSYATIQGLASALRERIFDRTLSQGLQ
jgi:transposase